MRVKKIDHQELIHQSTVHHSKKFGPVIITDHLNKTDQYLEYIDNYSWHHLNRINTQTRQAGILLRVIPRTGEPLRTGSSEGVDLGLFGPDVMALRAAPGVD
jgi:exopolysaccharide biosynthesis protein